MIIKNKKFIFQTLLVMLFIISFFFLNIKINKFDLCISSIEYFYNFNEKKVSKDFKLNLLNQIDKKNQQINYYYRFSHNIIATSSKDGECNKNSGAIIQNLKSYNDSLNLIKKIDYIKKIEIKKFLIFVFSILLLSVWVFFFIFIEFVRNEIKFTINKNKN